jgi:hypothetical protein
MLRTFLDGLPFFFKHFFLSLATFLSISSPIDAVFFVDAPLFTSKLFFASYLVTRSDTFFKINDPFGFADLVFPMG